MKRRTGTEGKRRQAGYSMVMLIMLIVGMTILTSAALPMWSSINQREREQELIFRGLQYAEAIRVFQKRYGRYPVRLEELMEVKPRCIRQLWKDPMTDEGQWELIFAGGPAGQIPGQPGQPGVPNTRRQGAGRQLQGVPDAEGDSSIEFDETPGGEESSLPESGFGKVRRLAVGPIAGVRSRAKSEESSFLVYMGQTSYDQWAFTVDLISGVANVPDLGPQVPNSARFWRPFPEGVTPGVSFTPQGLPQGGPGADGQRGTPNPQNRFQRRQQQLLNANPGLPPTSRGGGGAANDG